ncbi:hypothetical protein [Aestuariivivens marinum]|uniref:hypothetical protein n=1 Tax=Aestuariivivens marinum TaxID=2913555 RepID=UPI001F570208|nr:hypothetical protein [Aestuariivivens marinum]
MRLTMDYNTKSAIIGGTFFSTIMNIGVEDLITTVILAMVGAIVSFFVSLLLKKIITFLGAKFRRWK